MPSKGNGPWDEALAQRGRQGSKGKGRLGRSTRPRELSGSGRRSEDGEDARLRYAAALDRLVRAVRATKLHQEYTRHPIAKYVMTFKDYRDRSKRARILKQHGR
jgi:hypothetical protein